MNGGGEDPSVAGPEIPRLRDREERREKKGAGVPLSQSGAAGSGANLVPGPLVQAGRVLLGVGGAAGTAPPGLLKVLCTVAFFRLLPALTLALIAATPFCALYSAVGNRTGARSSQPAVFNVRASSVLAPESGRGQDGYDSLTYLIAGNQAPDPLRDALSAQQVQNEGSEPSEPKAEAGAPRPKPELPLPAALREAGEALKQETAKAAAPVEREQLAGGAGLSLGINRKFDPFGLLTRGRLASGLAGALSAQRSPYGAARRSGLGGKVGVSGAMNQLHATHRLSRKALGQGSAEGKADAASKAFNGGTLASAAPVRAAGEKNRGARSPGQTNVEFDGGPMSTPYSGNNEAPTLGQTADQSPWTPDIELAQEKLRDASSLITAIGLLAPLKPIPFVGIIAAAVQAALYDMAMSYTNKAAEIGASIQTDWSQGKQSDIVLTGSSITNVVAAAAIAAPVSVTAWSSVLGGVTGAAALIALILLPKV